MRAIGPVAGAVASLVVSLLAASPAFAASVMVVAADGNDANNCFSLSTACRSLQRGLNQASAGDVVELVTGGNFFSATATRSVTIFSRAGAFLTGGESPCLVVTAGASDVINVDGVGCIADPDGSHGIQFNSGKKLRIRNSLVRGGTGTACGIMFRPNTNAELNVEDTIVSENGSGGSGGGICIVPRTSADVLGVLDRVTAQNNGIGMRATAPAGFATNILIQNSTFSGNATGILSSGAASRLRVSTSSIYRNSKGLVASGGGLLISLGGNVLRTNSANGAFTSTETKQ